MPKCTWYCGLCFFNTWPDINFSTTIQTSVVVLNCYYIKPWWKKRFNLWFILCSRFETETVPSIFNIIVYIFNHVLLAKTHFLFCDVGLVFIVHVQNFLCTVNFFFPHWTFVTFFITMHFWRWPTDLDCVWKVGPHSRSLCDTYFITRIPN